VLPEGLKAYPIEKCISVTVLLIVETPTLLSSCSSTIGNRWLFKLFEEFKAREKFIA
jgi:hypothetical protein